MGTPKSENAFVLYHGTKVAFETFDFEKAADGAHYFTPIKEHAEHFGKVRAYRVAINNPLVINQDDLEKEWDKEHPEGEQDERYLLPRDFVDDFVMQAKVKGHDGLIIERFADLDFQTTVYLPLSADQILEVNMQANDDARDKLYAVLHDDALNYWTGVHWDGSIEEAVRFDPVKGLAAAYQLEEIYKDQLENTPVFIRVVDGVTLSDDQGKYVINTSQAKNWPQLETAFQTTFGVTLDRDMAIAFQHDAKRTDVETVKMTPRSVDSEIDQRSNFAQTLPERRQFMKERNTLESIVYAQATVQMLSHSSSFKNALEAFDYLGHCVKKQIEPIGLVRNAPFETMDWPHVHDYVQVMANNNVRTMKNLLDVAHKGMVAGAMEGEFDSADMNLLDLEDMMDRGNGLEAIRIPQSVAAGVSAPKYTDKALAAARGDLIVPLGDLKAVAYVDDESGVPAIKAQSPAVLEALFNRAMSLDSIVVNQDKSIDVDTWFFDFEDTDASLSGLGRVLKRLDVVNGESVLTELKIVIDQPISQTIDDAKLLVRDALAKVNLPAPLWRGSTGSIGPWEYTDVDVGSYRPLVIGASAGGVVSVDGDPFTPEARELNVTSTRVLQSIETGIDLLPVVPGSRINVAIYDTRGAAFTDIGKQTEAARILREAAKFIRDNDVYEGVQLHDANGNKVGAISGDWGNIGRDVYAAFVNPEDSKEVARLIDEVANFVEKGTTVFYLHDIDGKNIGRGSTVRWFEEQELDTSVDDVRNDMQM